MTRLRILVSVILMISMKVSLTEPFCGYCDHSVEPRQGAKVDAVQGNLHQHCQAERVHRDVPLILDFAPDVGEWKPLILCWT